MYKNLNFILLIFFITLVFILYIHSVNNKLTDDDYVFINKFVNTDIKISQESTYLEELQFIRSIQNSVLTVAPNAGSIPMNNSREPKDVYLAGVAGCSERVRVFSKIFKYYGFKTRQFSMYSLKRPKSSIMTLLTPRVRSHAALEVLTKKGWLVIDPNENWVSIDALNNPLSINKIQHDIENSFYINWKKPPSDEIYLHSFIYVYGLYSRHGRFYPPYNFIPDINYREFIQNAI